MVDIILPPETGDQDLDTWALQVTDAVSLVDGDAEGAVVGTDEEGRTTLEDSGGNMVVLGYPLKYLDIAFANDANGQGFVKRLEDLTPPTSTTTTFWQGFRNISNTDESTNPADFSWVQRNVTGGSLSGGRFTMPGFTNGDTTSLYHMQQWYILPSGEFAGITGTFLVMETNGRLSTNFPSGPAVELSGVTNASFSYINSSNVTVNFVSERIIGAGGSRILVFEIPADEVDGIEAEGANIRLSGSFPDTLIDDMTPANPLADFTTVGPAFIVTENATAQYRATGGRRIEWEYTDAPQDNFTVHMGGVIDLDDIATSIRGLPGIPGTDGLPGESAYELAVMNGFTGTLAEWLASLQGAMGADGSGTIVIYRTASTKPPTPGDSVDTPPEWQTTAPTVPDNEFLWISVGQRDRAGIPFSWSEPFLFSPLDIEVIDTGGGATIQYTDPMTGEVREVDITDGTDGISPTVEALPSGRGVRITDAAGTTVDVLDGNDGMDGDGLEVIYQNSSTVPTPNPPAPSAGAPNGWSFVQTAPLAGERTYVSIGTRTNNMGNYTWSIATQLTGLDGEQGEQGDRGDTGDRGPQGDPGSPPDVFRSIWLYQNAVSQPTPPLNNEGYTTGGAPTDVGLWRAVPEVPASNEVIWLARLDIIQRMGMGSFGPLGNWVVSQASGFNGQEGARGPIGPNGEQGTPAPRFAEIRLYTNPAVSNDPEEPPDRPEATIDWVGTDGREAGDLFNISAGWDTSPPVQIATSEEFIYSSRMLFIDISGIAPTTTVIGEPVVESTNFTGVVTFIDGQFAVGGGEATTIDGSNITTGTIAADRLNMNGPVDISAVNGALIAGRNSASDFDEEGFYIGRKSSDGVTADGFQLSSTSVVDSDTQGPSSELMDGTLQGIIHDSVLGLRLFEPTFYERTGTPTPAQIITQNNQTITLRAGGTHTITIVGGGGGGTGGSAGDRLSRNARVGSPGTRGTNTVINMTTIPSGYTGATSWTAVGGDGGDSIPLAAATRVYGPSRGIVRLVDGLPGERGPYGPGGAAGLGLTTTGRDDRDPSGGSAGGTPPVNAYGSGGGGGGSGGRRSSVQYSVAEAAPGGMAGQTITTVIDLTNFEEDAILTAQAIGVAGSGGAAGSSFLSRNGGDGRGGACSVASVFDGYETRTLSDISLSVPYLANLITFNYNSQTVTGNPWASAVSYDRLILFHNNGGFLSPTSNGDWWLGGNGRIITQIGRVNTYPNSDTRFYNWNERDFISSSSQNFRSTDSRAMAGPGLLYFQAGTFMGTDRGATWSNYDEIRSDRIPVRYNLETLARSMVNASLGGAG